MQTPLIKWPGGKRWLSSKIAPYLAATFDRYVEPFLGGGAMLFALEPSKAIGSDINHELISCDKAVKQDAQRVLVELKNLRDSEIEYYHVRDRWQPQCQFQCAARFIYLMRHSWNGLYRVNKQGRFNVPYCYRKRKDELTSEKMERAQSVLQRVDLKCQDFASVISKSKDGDLIFVDPPYFENGHDNFGRYNAVSFREEDQLQLSESLATAERKGAAWILTNASLIKIKNVFRRADAFILPRRSLIASKANARKEIHEFIVLSRSPRLEKLREHLVNTYQKA
jgi:DNA adenine methylase